MLTRLEVRGFKNLRDLTVELGPFTCIAGPNGVGKSNVFDVIQFMSELADRPLMEAAEAVRGTRSERSADPRDLFWEIREGVERSVRIAAEMIVPKEVEDDFGEIATATTTFLRYEIEIGFEEPSGLERRGRLVLLREDLRHITQANAAQHLRFPHSAKHFRAAVVQGRRSGKAYISTDLSGNEPVITVHQDGGSRGQPRKASAIRAPSTVVRTTSVRDDPTVLAARREMQGWRRLGLEPSALRAEDHTRSPRGADPRSMGPDGRHLSATLCPHRRAGREQRGRGERRLRAHREPAGAAHGRGRRRRPGGCR